MTARYDRRVQYYPLNPASMATACRKMARDLRAEAAAGWGSIGLTSIGGPDRKVTRWQAAASLDRQAERWEAEARGEGENVLDRERIGW